MVVFQLTEIAFKLLRHLLGVNPHDAPEILHFDQFSQIVQSRLPSNAVRNEQEVCIISFFLNDTINIPDNVGLFASGCPIRLNLD